MKVGERVSFTCEGDIWLVETDRVLLSIDGNHVLNSFSQDFARKNFNIIPPKPKVGDMVVWGDGSDHLSTRAKRLVYLEGNFAVLRSSNRKLTVHDYDQLRVVTREDSVYPYATKTDKDD